MQLSCSPSRSAVVVTCCCVLLMISSSVVQASQVLVSATVGSDNRPRRNVTVIHLSAVSSSSVSVVVQYIPPDPTSVPTGTPIVLVAMTGDNATAPYGFNYDSSVLLNNNGRTQNQTSTFSSLVFLTCGRFSIAAIATPRTGPVVVSKLPLVVTVIRMPGTCTGYLFPVPPNRSTPLTTPLAFKVPVDTSSYTSQTIADAFLALHPEYATETSQFIVTYGQKKNSARNVTRSITNVVVGLDQTVLSVRDIFVPLDTLYATVVDSCGAVTPQAVAFLSIATRDIYTAQAAGAGPTPASSKPTSTEQIVVARSGIVNGPTIFRTQTVSPGMAWATLQNVVLGSVNLESIQASFFLPEQLRGRNGALFPWSPTLSPDDAAAVTACSTYDVHIAVTYPPPMPRALPVEVTSSLGWKFNIADMASNDHVLKFRFPANFARGVETLAGYLTFTADVAVADSPRGYLWVVGDQGSGPTVVQTITKNQTELLKTASQQQALVQNVIQIGNVLYYPAVRVQVDGDASVANGTYAYEYTVVVPSQRLAFTLLSSNVTFTLSTIMFPGAWRPAVRQWSFLVDSQSIDDRLAVEVLSYMALLGRQLDLGSILVTRSVADCSLDYGLPVNPSIYPLGIPLGDTRDRFFQGAVVFNSALVFGTFVIEVLLHAIVGGGDRSRFPHYTLVVARMFHTATAFAAFEVLPNNSTSYFQYVVFGILLTYIALLPFASTVILKLAKVPWDDNELMRAYDDVDELYHQIQLLQAAASTDLYARDRKVRKLEAHLREVEQRLGTNGSGSGRRVKVPLKEKIKRLFKKRGTYSILHPDHARAQSTFERYRGSLRYWGTVDMIYFTGVAASGLIPCPARAGAVLGLIAFHLGALLLTNPYITVALNMTQQFIELSQMIGAALVVSQQERVAQYLFSIATYTAIINNFSWFVLRVLGDPFVVFMTSRFVRAFWIQDSDLRSKPFPLDEDEDAKEPPNLPRSVHYAWRLYALLNSIKHSRAQDNEFYGKQIKQLQADAVAKVQNLVSKVLELPGELLAKPTDGHDEELTDHRLTIDLGPSFSQPPASDALPGPPAGDVVVDVPAAASREGNPPPQKKDRNDPSNWKAVDVRSAWDELDDFLGEQQNPVKRAYAAAQPSTADRIEERMAELRKQLSTNAGLVPSARRAYQRELGELEVALDQELMKEYTKAHFEQFSEGRSLRRMAAQDTICVAQGLPPPRRQFTYFPEVQLAPSAAGALAQQNLNYIPASRSKTEFVARVEITKKGVRPIFKSREIPLDDPELVELHRREMHIKQVAQRKQEEAERQAMHLKNLRLREFRDDVVGGARAGDSDSSLDDKLGWKAGDKVDDEARKRRRLRRRDAARLRDFYTAAELEEEALYREEHFRLHSEDRSKFEMRPKPRTRCKSRSAFYGKVKQDETKEESLLRGDDDDDEDDEDKMELDGGTFKDAKRAGRQPQQPRGEQRDEEGRLIPRLKKGRNIVRDQVHMLRLRGLETPASTLEPTNSRRHAPLPTYTQRLLDREADEYMML